MRGLRRVWGLPYNTHNELLPVLCNILHVIDVICKRVLYFVHTRVNSDSVIVSYISRYPLLHGRMSSPLGRNALYCRLRYGLDVSSIFSHQFNPGRIICKRHMYNISSELQIRVEVLKDMLMYIVDKRQCILTNDEL